MFRKTILRIVAVSLLLLATALASTAAARPLLPVKPVAQPPAPAPFGPLPKVELDLTTVDAGIPSVELKKSLTAEQQQALSKVMDRHQAQFKAIAQQLPNPAEEASKAAPSNGQSPSMDSAQIEAELKRAQAELKAAQAAFAQLKEVQAQIDAETEAILSPQQFALHKEALSPAVKSLAIADAQIRSATAPWAKTSATPAANTSYCYYGAQNASLARYWAYYAYSNAYYNYAYYSSNADAYYAQYYLYYAQYYGYYAVQYLGGAYFDLIDLGSDFNSNGYYGAGYEYNTEYYAYYGYVNAYNNYYYSGGSGYAYNAYAYGYNANYYGYYGYIYGLYCY